VDKVQPSPGFKQGDQVLNLDIGIKRKVKYGANSKTSKYKTPQRPPKVFPDIPV
jgi:hypothetical protein